LKKRKFLQYLSLDTRELERKKNTYNHEPQSMAEEFTTTEAVTATGGHDQKGGKGQETVAQVLSTAEGTILDLQQARDATAIEHTLSIKQALRVYAPAIVWTFLFSMGNVMVGFDPQLVGTLVAIPEFQKQYGHPYDGAYVVRAQWQSAFNLGAPLGAILGSYFISWPLDKLGRRWTLGICSVGSIVAVAIQVSGQTKVQLLIAELFNGLFIGGYSVVVPTYISEITPVVLRGVATASINICQVAGQLVCSGILAGTQNRGDRWSYGIPMACQWFFPVAIFIGVFMSPESPWWLVRQGKNDEARKALDRLTTTEIDTDTLLANIVLTTQLENAQHAEVRFMDLFKGPDRRRTIITTMAFCTQVFSGTAFVISYCVYFFELAGLGTANAFGLGCGVLGVGFVGNCLSWLLIARFGRRPIYLFGLLALTGTLLLIGILDVIPSYGTNSAIRWVQSSMMLLWNFAYDLTIGPVAYIILCESSSARLRGYTIAFATAMQFVVNLIAVIGVPYAINPEVGNLRGKLGFVYFGVALPCLLWVYFGFPEFKGRTYEELDTMFEARVPTRKFSTYVFDDAVHNLGHDVPAESDKQLE
jgi:sugar porter (SP) family MFS transporter